MHAAVDCLSGWLLYTSPESGKRALFLEELPSHALSPSVHQVSPHVVTTLIDIVRTCPFASYSNQPEACKLNIEHLVSVLVESLRGDDADECVATSDLSPSQRTTDFLAVQTFFTDLFAKGLDESIVNRQVVIPLVPMRTIDHSYGTSAASYTSIDFLHDVQGRVADNLLTIMLHGVIAPQVLFDYGCRANLSVDECRLVCACVYGHHMSVFLAWLFARARLVPNFVAIAQWLPPGDAARLSRLYQTSIDLAGKWWPRMAAVSLLSDNEQEEMYVDACDMRESIAELSRPVRMQLLKDDQAQFTRIGLRKWIHMIVAEAPEKTSTRAVLQSLCKSVQNYQYWNDARGVSAAFALASESSLKRIGIVLQLSVPSSNRPPMRRWVVDTSASVVCAMGETTHKAELYKTLVAAIQ